MLIAELACSTVNASVCLLAKLTCHITTVFSEIIVCFRHSQNSGHIMSGASCKANGAVYPASSAMMNSVKKPKMEQIQADHELFLQAFESEISQLDTLLCGLSVLVT